MSGCSKGFCDSAHILAKGVPCDLQCMVCDDKHSCRQPFKKIHCFQRKKEIKREDAYAFSLDVESRTCRLKCRFLCC